MQIEPSGGHRKRTGAREKSSKSKNDQGAWKGKKKGVRKKVIAV